MFILVCLQFCGLSQNYRQIKSRFDNYLNFHGSLNTFVDVSPDKIIFYNTQKKTEFTLQQGDWKLFAYLLKTLPEDSLESIYLHESRLVNYKLPDSYQNKKTKQNKIKIKIDPGHIAGNMTMAHIEQKFLHFSKQNYSALKQDSIDVAEGMLTFQTASILKKMLEEKDFTVTLTRQDNGTSFGCTYDDWLKNYKRKTLDSLLSINKITTQKHAQLLKESASKFFIAFFKDYELQQRARVINAYKPDLTVIIHYNVDEKNTDWKKPSNKDFCMTFIPGCLIADNIKSVSAKINLLRLLLTGDLDESEKISSLVVHQLSRELNLPIAKKTDASYLSEHCLSSPSAGVYSRNLALCRMVQTPLVYGECLYQDSDNEYEALTKTTETYHGIKTNKRVISAAQSFYNAILQFYEK